MRTKLVAANWKLNGNRADNARWIEQSRALRASEAGAAPVDVAVCAPYVYLPQLVESLGEIGQAGAQDLSVEASGAHTGDVSAQMLVDIGVRWVIVGHSERRQSRGEDDATVAAKTSRATAAGLRPIVCVGETLQQRDAGQALAVVRAQVEAILAGNPAASLLPGAIAYEPVWAIGTGRTATPQQAQEIHAAIRAIVAERDAATAAQLRVLYGGSVNTRNAAELFAQPDIDGGLIGGASLVAADFDVIRRAAAAR